MWLPGSFLIGLLAAPPAWGAPAVGAGTAPETSAPVRPDPAAPGLSQAMDLSRAFSAVAEAVSAATVYIEAEKGPQVAPGMQELARDFDLPRTRRGSEVTSTGSGVIISPQGLVLTNHHVVAGAEAPTVTLFDRRSFPARIVGSDARTDVALLQIEGEGPFAWAAVGQSEAVRVGQWVLAVGHPFDFQFTVTSGLVSALGRRNLFQNEIQDYLQTDAAVNPGSSGGPLFDLEGRIIGINTAIYTPPGGGTQNSGISFAIPIDMAMEVVRQLQDTGRVARASLGIATRDRPAGPDQPRPGAEVTRVAPGSPAERAGLQEGDVLIAVDGGPILGSDDLRSLVLARGAQAELALRWTRDGQEMEARVRTAAEARALRTAEERPADARVWAGLTLGTASPGQREARGLPAQADAAGLLVFEVEAGSPGADAGLEPGDLLLSLGDAALHDPLQLLVLVAERRSVTLRFWREGGEAWAALGGLR